MNIFKNKFIKISLITLGILFIMIIFLFKSGIVRYLVMNLDDYDYNPILKHEEYNDYKLQIPYDLVPLDPNFIGLNKTNYYQLKNIDTNFESYYYSDLNFYSIFRNNEFEFFEFDVDDSNYVVSLFVIKEYKENELLEFKHELKSVFNLLSKNYTKKYNIYKYVNKFNNHFLLQWKSKDYFIDLKFVNYLNYQKEKETIYYSVAFSKRKIPKSIFSNHYYYDEFVKIDNDYLKKLGLK